MAIIVYHPHLTLDDRIKIKTGLNSDLSLNEIAASINKDPRSVSREIKKHRIDRTNYHLRNEIVASRCLNFKNCKSLNKTHSSDSYHSLCSVNCPNFKELECHLTDKFPFVCCRCKKKFNCKCNRYDYDPRIANDIAVHLASSSKIGTSLELEELEYLTKSVHSGLNKGQPLAHIYSKNINLQRICSLRYIYTLIERGLLKNVDAFSLRRKVRYRTRKKKSYVAIVRSNKIGRSYLDFLRKHKDIPFYVQMDTVIGKRDDEPVLLTLLITQFNFMFARLLPCKTSQAVVTAFNELQDIMGRNTFRRIFNVILTDNGSEFYSFQQLETDPYSNRPRLSIFFCDPRMSQQKGAIEKNHEFIRYIIPQGTSFIGLTQNKLNVLLSHVNSTFRPKLGTTPYEALVNSGLLSNDILRKLGLNLIPPQDLNLTPKILK